jgi:CBS domain-containing protein
MNSSTPLIPKFNQNTTVKILMRHVKASQEGDGCLSVLQVFQENPNLFAIPVINKGGAPLGIIDRHVFIEVFIKPYARELNAKRKIADFMLEKPIVVDMSTTIDDVSKIILNAGMRHMVTGFIITENGLYAGIANGHDLFNEMMQKKQENLFYLAHYDQLTSLPNRLLFMDLRSKPCLDPFFPSDINSQLGKLVNCMISNTSISFKN